MKVLISLIFVLMLCYPVSAHWYCGRDFCQLSDLAQSSYNSGVNSELISEMDKLCGKTDYDKRFDEIMMGFHRIEQKVNEIDDRVDNFGNKHYINKECERLKGVFQSKVKNWNSEAEDAGLRAIKLGCW